MNKTEIKESRVQDLIENMMNLYSIVISQNGQRCKGQIKELQNIAKELEKRELIDYESFLKNMNL